MSTTNGSSIFTGIYAGLTNTFSVLANASPSGVTLSSISSARSNTALAATLNPTFASYIQTNFSTLDKDGDGVISSSELSTLTTQISTQGLTRQQLTQLGPASGMSNQSLEQVLEHFSDIDANHDGKVTTAEISAYTIKSAEDKKKTEFANKAATNMSMFYGNDDSSAVDSSSILDYRYMNSGNNGNS